MELLLGTAVDSTELVARGFIRLALEFTGKQHELVSGMCSDWNTVGEVPDAPGLYAFVLERPGQLPRVTYVGLTSHLWMVTKGTLPNYHSRPGQRYGRPKWAGVTRERVNREVCRARDAGYVVSHWVLPMPGADAAALLVRERELIERWGLARVGWNRR